MTEKLNDFQQLNVWQKAHAVVLEVYGQTKKFPKDDRNELGALIRKEATLIPVKIAEGFMRRSPREKEFAYKASQNAIEGLKYYIILSRDLGLIKDEESLLLSIEEVARMLTGLVRSTKHK